MTWVVAPLLDAVAALATRPPTEVVAVTGLAGGVAVGLVFNWLWWHKD